MKIQSYIGAALLFVGSLSWSNIYTAEIQIPKLNKIYVDSEAIIIAKEGIFIITEKGLRKTTILRSDKKGLFVLDQNLSSIEKKMYTCPYCPRMFSSESALWKHMDNCELR